MLKNMKNVSSLSVYIISWLGQHNNATLIAEKLLAITNNVTIVYSDPDPIFSLDAPCTLIRRPDALFWEDKFKSCLDACGEGPILLIHADCQCDDWTQLFKRYLAARMQFGNIGVWAPKISGTYYNLSVTKIATVSRSDLKIVALTDGIIFALSRRVVSRMRKVTYGNNPMGWGIDLLFCSFAHASNQLVVVDSAVEVQHPKSTGYDVKTAQAGMLNFFEQFSLNERVQAELLRSFVRSGQRNILEQRELIRPD